MGSASIAVLILFCVFGSALFGMWLARVLPGHHLSPESLNTVKLVTGLVATLSALVLGLLTASAKDAYDSTNQEFRNAATRVVLIDHALGAYGPEANEVRVFLRDSYRKRIEQLFPDDRSEPTARLAVSRQLSVESAEIRLRALTPPNEAKQAQLSRALVLLDELSKTGWLLSIEMTDTSLPPLMLIVLVGWLCLMFAGFGLFAPRNGMVITTLFVGALAVSTAIFLIEEMSHPLDGLIRISGAPMRAALDVLGP